MGSSMPFMSMNNAGAGGDMSMMYQRMMNGMGIRQGMGMGMMDAGRGRPGMKQGPGPVRVNNRGQHGFNPYGR